MSLPFYDELKALVGESFMMQRSEQFYTGSGSFRPHLMARSLQGSQMSVQLM